jgi:hypothetical protein
VYVMSGCEMMSNVPAQGAGLRARRSRDYGLRPMSVAEMQGAPAMGVGQCHFPAPHPMRIYCQPASFHRVNGQEYHNMTVAYGASRPLDRYY